MDYPYSSSAGRTASQQQTPPLSPHSTSPHHLPPSLVTVENGFAFSSSGGGGDGDDSTTSDLSSLNTTPQKNTADRKYYTASTSTSPLDDIVGYGDEADVEVSRSRANVHSGSNYYSRTATTTTNAARRSTTTATTMSSSRPRSSYSMNNNTTHASIQQVQGHTNDNNNDPALPPMQVVVQAGSGGGAPQRSQQQQQQPYVRKTATTGTTTSKSLQDRKEKYRRMAAVETRISKNRIRRKSSAAAAAAAATNSTTSGNMSQNDTTTNNKNVLTSWKKQADQRRKKEELRQPWFVDDDDGPEDEQDELLAAAAQRRDKKELETDDDSDDEESEPEVEDGKDGDTTPNETTVVPEKEPLSTTVMAKASTSTAATASASEEQRKNRSIVAVMKTKFEAEKSFHPPDVDIYGCPIFRVDSEESHDAGQNDITNTDDEGMEQARAKLDELDTKMDEQDETTTDYSITAMLSSASFFSISAAQTLADASNEGAKLLGDAAQGVEALVLGPVHEIDESQVHSETEDDGKMDEVNASVVTPSHDNHGLSSRDDDTTETTPPPPPPPPTMRPSFPGRGRSPTPVAGSTNARGIHHHDDSLADNSFVLEDKSDVDVHYVLDDLAFMEKTKETVATTSTTTDQRPPTVDDATMQARAVDISSESEMFVEDEKAQKDALVISGKEAKEMDDRQDQESSSEAVNVTPSELCDSLEVNVTDDALADESPLTLEKTTAPVEREAAVIDVVSDDKTRKTPKNASARVETRERLTVNASAVYSKSYRTNTAQVDHGPHANGSAPAGESTKKFGKTTTSQVQTKDVEQAHPAADSYSSVSSEELIPLPAAIATAIGNAGLVAAVTVPENDEGTSPIIVSKVPTSDTEPEFPPTDDADVDMINFDSVSVKSEVTPVRGNLDDSKEGRKAKPRVPDTRERKSGENKTGPAAPQETAPSASKATAPSASKSTKVQKHREKKAHASPELSKASSSATVSNVSNASKEGAAKPKPAMVKTLDDNNGIAKGDMVLSLLNSNLSEVNYSPKGADQVRDAILRMRDMRKRQEKVEMSVYEADESGETEGEASAKRSALPVDVDDMRVVGAFEHVKTLEDDAIEHLKHDEIEEALELYEEIVSIYTEAFRETAKKRKKKLKSDHKGYIGAALHNIGILLLLKFDFEEALAFFEKAAENREAHFGEGSVDHLASLCKIALCHYAMDEYETAHNSLERVLELSKNHLAGLTDFMQVAEVLNNLGCLSFMCGQASAAMTMFAECLEIQTAVLKQSLYSGPRLAGQSTSLSIAVTRGNIGYVQMLTKNADAAIVEYEASLMHQQMILSDAHDSLICTMDHLAVANLMAKRKEEAIKMLGRMLSAQLAAYGPIDKRCVLTLSKLQLVQNEEADYLEKALDQIWNHHSKSAGPSKAARVAATKKSNKMVKRFSFRKKVAKLNH